MDMHQSSVDLTSEAKSEISPLPEAVLPPTDTATAWLVVLASFLNLMLSIGVTTTYGVFLQYYKLEEFPDASTSFLSWIGTLQTASMCFFGIGAGVLCEHIDTRLLSLCGALISGLALIIASFCNSPWKLLLTQGLMFGAGGSLLYITGLTLPPQWFTKYRALATGIAIAGSGIGGLWLSFATRAMMTSIGRQWGLRITGLIIIGICGPTSWLMRMRFRAVRNERVIELAFLRDCRFALLFFAALFGACGFYIPFYFMPSYSAIVLGKSNSWGTSISSIMNGTSIFGRVAMGLVGDRVGSLNTLCTMTLLSCLGILVLWLPFTSVGPFVAAAVIFGLCSGGIVSLIPVVTANIFGVKRLPSTIGLLMLAYTFGDLISSPPAGAILDKYGHGTSFTSLIIYNGVFLALSTICDILLRIILSRKLWEKV
ncbi:hypothetical protein IW137_004207 [Coemansia sp. RSA 1287]|nr:hypothetical protein LPJ69_003106 [Coemansia sp. RSA 1752]KAJ1787958.1 hypothetical protein LPJ67_003013 [Coemansia sp. RSA 1938]KAJ2635367.1 hypothetical protein IW137_004207 [Coemansia sp. RSA 1287]